jgi:hypothetical protein
MLKQNYPNPFNPTTTIAYAVPAAAGERPGPGVVRLTVYDLLGREVAVLLDESMSPGVHEVEFSADRLPSGVYYYTLRTPGGALTRSMRLIR